MMRKDAPFKGLSFGLGGIIYGGSLGELENLTGTRSARITIIARIRIERSLKQDMVRNVK